MEELVFCNILPTGTGVANAFRQRAWHSKTRSGCDTCKQRRIKCDETKPTCLKCQKKSRSCSWTTLKANIFDSTSAVQVAPQPGAALTVPGTPSDKRALKFFLEQTGPAMAAHLDYTKTFWEVTIPQLATSEVALRQLTIALASRQEGHTNTAASDVHRLSLQKTERENFVSGLSSLTRGSGSTLGDAEVLLVASVMFLGYGSLAEIEEQTAQEVEHWSSGLKILLERAQDVRQPQRSSNIIDVWMRPILVRLELVYSWFMTPQSPTGYAVVIEPQRPILPPRFPDIAAARQSFFEICCYRYQKSIRSADWTYHSAAFRSVRQLMLDWHKLVTQLSTECNSELDQHRARLMLSQFRVLFVSFLYSARTDLHCIQDHLRPTAVTLQKRNHLTLQYELPKRYLQQLPGLEWESRDDPDPLQVRLWPRHRVTSIREDSASMNVTYYV